MGTDHYALTKVEDADDELVFICLNAAHPSRSRFPLRVACILQCNVAKNTPCRLFFTIISDGIPTIVVSAVDLEKVLLYSILMNS